MNHLRKQIRDAVAALLKSVPDLSSMVHVNRDVPFDDSELPAIKVTTSGTTESIQILTQNYPVKYERAQPVKVEIYARNLNRVENTLDMYAVQIETILGSITGFGLSGLVKRLYLDSTEIDTTTEADVQVGVLRLNYMAIYQTRCDMPGQQY